MEDPNWIWLTPFSAIGLSKNDHPMLRQKKHRELPLQHLPEFLPSKMTIAFHFTKLAGIWGPSWLKNKPRKWRFVGQILKEFSPHHWLLKSSENGSLSTLDASMKRVTKIWSNHWKKLPTPIWGSFLDLWTRFSDIFQHCPNLLHIKCSGFF